MNGGQVMNYNGGAVLLDDPQKAQCLIGNRGYDADWFRDPPREPSGSDHRLWSQILQRTEQYDKRRYHIKIMFGRLEDWRRVATRYDRCPTLSFSAIAPAAVIF